MVAPTEGMATPTKTMETRTKALSSSLSLELPADAKESAVPTQTKVFIFIRMFLAHINLQDRVTIENQLLNLTTDVVTRERVNLCLVFARKASCRHCYHHF